MSPRTWPSSRHFIRSREEPSQMVPDTIILIASRQLEYLPVFRDEYAVVPLTFGLRREVCCL